MGLVLCKAVKVQKKVNVTTNSQVILPLRPKRSAILIQNVGQNPVHILFSDALDATTTGDNGELLLAADDDGNGCGGILVLDKIVPNSPVKVIGVGGISELRVMEL